MPVPMSHSCGQKPGEAQIKSWMNILSPEFPRAALASTCTALLLKILHLNLFHPDLIRASPVHLVA